VYRWPSWRRQVTTACAQNGRTLNTCKLIVAVDFQKGIVWIKRLGALATMTTLTSMRSILNKIKPIRSEADYETALA
jgi:hypothetical protein